MRMGVLVFFALIGMFTSIFLVGLAGMFIWCWWVEHLDRKPTKTLKQLKKQWEAIPVERR